MQLIFDHHFFYFLSENYRGSTLQKRFFLWIAQFLKWRIFSILLYVIERILAFILSLPIPIYSTLIPLFLDYLDGFSGYYFRALYYSNQLKKFQGNIIIEQHVKLKNPKNYQIDRFVFLDYGCTILCDELHIESGCHLAVHSLITGGGKVLIGKYSGLGIRSTIISATDTIQKGIRHSGPMIPTSQRYVLRPTTVIEADAWSTTHVTILPGVTLGEGSVVLPGSVVMKDTAPWCVYGPERIKKYGKRKRVQFSDPDYHMP